MIMKMKKSTRDVLSRLNAIHDWAKGISTRNLDETSEKSICQLCGLRRYLVRNDRKGLPDHYYFEDHESRTRLSPLQASTYGCRDVDAPAEESPSRYLADRFPVIRIKDGTYRIEAAADAYLLCDDGGDVIMTMPASVIREVSPEAIMTWALGEVNRHYRLAQQRGAREERDKLLYGAMEIADAIIARCRQ